MAIPIKNLVYSFLGDGQDWKIKLIQEWDTIVGKLNTKVSLEKIYEDVLVLGVKDSCWMQELYMLSSLIIDSINIVLGQPRIKNIHFKHITKTRSLSFHKSTSFKRKDHTIALSMQERNALSKISDPELRNALASFLIRCHQERI